MKFKGDVGDSAIEEERKCPLLIPYPARQPRSGLRRGASSKPQPVPAISGVTEIAEVSGLGAASMRAVPIFVGRIEYERALE